MLVGLRLIFPVCLLIRIESSLILVQILARHGDRTPSHTFPTDPFKQKWNKLGMEQMTQLGMQQHLQLGHYLRKRYSDFIPLQYHKDEIYVRSTSTERTLMSAQCCMTSLFPAIKEDKASQVIGHQSVPINSVFKPYDQLLKMSSPCPKFKKLLKIMQQASPAFRSKERENEQFVSYLNIHSGLKNLTLLKAIDVCDPIAVMHLHQLSLPKWINSSIVERCLQLNHFKHTYRFSTPELSRLKGGPLIRKMITDMNIAIDSLSKSTRRRKFIGYFAHDSTLAAFMSHLRVHNNRKPPLASCIMVELHQSSSSSTRHSYFVRLFYRNDTSMPPYPLQIRGYPNADIKFDDLVKTFLDDTPLDIATECELADKKFTTKIIWERKGWMQGVIVLLAIIGAFTLVKNFQNLFYQKASRYFIQTDHKKT